MCDPRFLVAGYVHLYDGACQQSIPDDEPTCGRGPEPYCTLPDTRYTGSSNSSLAAGSKETNSRWAKALNSIEPGVPLYFLLAIRIPSSAVALGFEAYQKYAEREVPGGYCLGGSEDSLTLDASDGSCIGNGHSIRGAARKKDFVFV